ncbi:type II toxin-antitoxin system Phd/YefM family antitoxin [Chlorobium sp. BLA1]|uniref:type II toxin-antitoxin system Phd/YefM family antitoxin n=1 Tax=Candidatus Chlorobium masyuteum TaxID=2716876 RepID=UPI00141ED798|nr:type II toxin-antitoxin system Phd/YefM family antitoxin [Candidatus Chlorobium masyuteum]NHQ60261.1 type II toxin-antitoxin system Phd/YefM family antitoxin [Candidatus Chlorobium masyuteum]NTU44481.1 type II toxin-antitoxin system Phd/YefM family antitoxin [Chlorobiaceae bacterium]
MKYSTSIKPISFLKTHASEVIREVSANRGTMIITHNGEAKVIVQDVHLYEETQESLALLKILAQSSQSIEKGRYKPVSESFELIRQQISNHQEL